MRATGLRGGKPADPSVPSPPLRRSPCSSIRKGVPLYGWKNRGEAPRRWLLSEPRLGGFRAERRGRAGASRPPHHKHPSGQRAPPRPPLRYQARFTGSLGWCQSSRMPSLPPRGPCVFPWTTLPSSPPTPAEAECQGRTRGLGPARGAGHGSAPGGAGPGGRAGPSSTDRFSRGESGLCPAWEAKSLASPATPPPCHKAADLDPAASTFQSLLNHPKMECDRCDLSPPELGNPPL